MFICQLPVKEKLAAYKAVKRELLHYGVFSYENLRNAMCGRVCDIDPQFMSR